MSADVLDHDNDASRAQERRVVTARELTGTGLQGVEYALTDPDNPDDWLYMSHAALAFDLSDDERPESADVGDDVVVFDGEDSEPAVLDPSMLLWVRDGSE